VLKKIRKVYYFGYGADSEPDLLHAITGRRPKVIGTALLQNYELRIQELAEVTTKGLNPQEILRKAWGNDFKSYVIVAKAGAEVRGTLYRLSLHDKHLIDVWELVDAGWYEKAFVNVGLVGTPKVYQTETQVLAPKQSATISTDGATYTPWLMPKERLLFVAESLRRIPSQP